MVRSQRTAAYVATGVALALAVFLWARVEIPAAAQAGPAARAAAPRPGGDVPRIGLERLTAPRGESQAGQRDVFAFGPAATPRKAAGEAVPVATLPVVPVETLPTPPPVAPLSVKLRRG
jgi:hypothetical protein